jgi:hypothetical protein
MKGNEMGENVPTITIWYEPHFTGDVIAYACDHEGYVIASHLCSTPSWVQYDMGFMSDRKHDLYDKRYPDGYRLSWSEHMRPAHTQLREN